MDAPATNASIAAPVVAQKPSRGRRSKTTDDPPPAKRVKTTGVIASEDTQPSPTLDDPPPTTKAARGTKRSTTILEQLAALTKESIAAMDHPTTVQTLHTAIDNGLTKGAVFDALQSHLYTLPPVTSREWWKVSASVETFTKGPKNKTLPEDQPPATGDDDDDDDEDDDSDEDEEDEDAKSVEEIEDEDQDEDEDEDEDED